jgi:steroid 5-alpha reductase family enzyme
MSFIQIWLLALLVILVLMTTLWIFSVVYKNVSIVDLFWGIGFILVSAVYFKCTDGNDTRKTILMILVTIWGLRLSGYLAWRNIGKGEDFRYRQFRQTYGEHRYWWISYFQTFLSQGLLMWLISAPLLGAQFLGKGNEIGLLDFAGLILWLTGFIFEAVGDYQMARFKTNIQNKGKVMDNGLWRYTRHPNYFGDSSVWWGYGLICLSAGSYIPIVGSILMTILIIKISGVTLLEKSLKENRPGYKEYIEKTSAFIPWFPKKTKPG